MNDTHYIGNVNGHTRNAVLPDSVAAAIRYREAGLYPVHFDRGTKGPEWKGWPDERVSPDAIPKLFKDKNVGINCGASGIAVIDADCDEAAAIAARFLPKLLGRTLVGGRPGNPASHYFYYTDGAIENTMSILAPDGTKVLELLAGRRQCVVPPSVHPDGDIYDWNGEDFDAERIATVRADELIAKFRLLGLTTLIAKYMPPVGARHQYAMDLAGLLRRDERVPHDMVVAAFEMAWRVAGGGGGKAEREAVACIADTEAKLKEDGAAVRGGTSLNQMVDGLASKLLQAAGVDRDAWKNDGKRRSTKDAPSHTTLRDRWIANYPTTLFSRDEFKRYNPASGLWESVADRVIEDSVWRILEEAEGEGIKPSDSVVRSVLSAIKARTYRPPDLWDADPNILVAANGAVNVMTGKLSDHSPEHYATTGVPYDFDPFATCPNWLNLMCWVDEQGEEYLKRRADELDIDLPETDGPSPSSLLQEYVGLALTPETKYEKLLILTGVRGTGKSTIIEGILEMVGEGRSGGLNIEDVVSSRYGYARIPGKTLLTGTEQPSVFIKYTNKIEALVSGEIVRVEEKYKAGYDFRPTAKIIWGSNELPKIANGGAGIFRRLLILRFPFRLPPGEKDVELKAKIREEAPGILNWALGGLRRLNERGDFELPHSVKWAVEEFEGVADTEARFLAEVCILGNGSKDEFRIKPADLYSRYRGWCTVTGHTPKSATNVALDWERLGLTRKRIRGNNLWCGLKIDTTEYEDIIETHIDKASTNPSRY